MWMYFEYGKIKFNLLCEKSILEKISLMFKCSFDNIKLSESNTEKTDWTVITYKRRENHTIIDRKSQTIIYEYDSEYEFLEIYSFLREMIVKLTVEKGWFWVHACCFEINGKVTIVLGTKGSGKTTSLLYAANRFSANIIGNDQIPIYVSNGKLCTYTWRVDVKSTVETINLFENNKINLVESENSRVMIFPEYDYYKEYDFDGMKKLTGQEILPYIKYGEFNYCFVSKGEYILDNIIILDENIEEESSKDRKYILKSMKNLLKDREFITPSKAREWKKYISYWNKRITNLKITEESIKAEKKIFECFTNEEKITVIKAKTCLNTIGRIIGMKKLTN